MKERRLGKYGNCMNKIGLRSFFKDKKVFVTGHTGFKGSWLSLFIQSLGADVKGFSLPPQEGSFFKIVEMDTLVKGHYGNLNDYPLLEKTLKEFSPDIVFHLAAQAIVSDSYLNPLNTYSANVMGTACLLEAVRKTPSVKVVVNITTDKCYQNKEWAWKYRENDELGGRDAYSTSKAASELVSLAYYHSYFKKAGIKLGTARAGNVIGGGDFATDRLIPDFIRAAEKDDVLSIRCPSAIRPWQHVLDCNYGYLLLAQYLWDKECNNVESYNFAPDDVKSISVLDILNYISSYINLNKGVHIASEAGFKEDLYLTLDNSKAKRELNWFPAFDINESIKYTAEWYEVYLKNKNRLLFLPEITFQQIHKYLKIRSEN